MLLTMTLLPSYDARPSRGMPGTNRSVVASQFLTMTADTSETSFRTLADPDPRLLGYCCQNSDDRFPEDGERIDVLFYSSFLQRLYAKPV